MPGIEPENLSSTADMVGGKLLAISFTEGSDYNYNRKH